MTLKQIEHLAETTGSSNANVISFAIDRIYQQESKIMRNKRIFKASEIDPYRDGWIADIIKPAVVNPDCYFSFATKQDAQKFIELVDSGMSASEAVYIVNENK